MYLYHTGEIWRQFPQLVPGIIVIEGIDSNLNSEPKLSSWFQLAIDRLKQSTESQLPEIAAWRQAYSKMGLKPSKYRSAAEALLRRFRREKNIPRLHPIVDLCNAVSIAFALPVAVFDLDNIDQYIKICHADGTERYLSFSDGIETPPQGEIIFKDASNNAHARRWTFRQSKLSAVQSSTIRALVISEGMHSTALKDVQNLIENLSQELSSLGVFTRGKTFLSARSPRFEFDI